MIIEILVKSLMILQTYCKTHAIFLKHDKIF
jgi:hypothetical protein